MGGLWHQFTQSLILLEKGVLYSFFSVVLLAQREDEALIKGHRLDGLRVLVVR